MKPRVDNNKRVTIPEPFRTRVFRACWRLSGRRSKLDQFLSTFLTYRKYLPECDAEQAIPDFLDTEVRVQQFPLGAWSTPLGDVLVVIKTALGFHSKRILELGSYRGDTARMLAENTGDEVTICAVDIDERHGSAYSGKPIARKIIRKTGRISMDLFAPDEKFDFIFVDANHDFASVMNDTEVAFKVLADGGVILWHDYFMDTYFHGLNCVAEALNCFSKDHAIYAIRGTRLAIFSNYNHWQTSSLSSRMQQISAKTVWDEKQIRG